MGILGKSSSPTSGQQTSLVVMWHRLKNLVLSLKTYKALSPDLKVRQRVNSILRRRPALNASDWFETFYQPRGITCSIATFAYTHLQRYSGLEFARVLPSDRLYEDLHWSEVCGFDWELTLCDDFCRQFSVDISHYLHCSQWSTVDELICFLNQQLA